MTVDLAHTYTDPPQRIAGELAGQANQDLFERVKSLLAELPDIGQPTNNSVRRPSYIGSSKRPVTAKPSRGTTWKRAIHRRQRWCSCMVCQTRGGNGTTP
jgi:hypothetical protein